MFEKNPVFSDEQLIQMLRQRKRESISLLYDKYASPIYGTILREVGNIAVAEEILQQVFVNMWETNINSKPENTHLLLWMLNNAKQITSRVVEISPNLSSVKKF